MKYLTELRIEKAKELIATNSMSLSNIAQMTGFNDPLYFSRVFKKDYRNPSKGIPAVFTHNKYTKLVG